MDIKDYSQLVSKLNQVSSLDELQQYKDTAPKLETEWGTKDWYSRIKDKETQLSQQQFSPLLQDYKQNINEYANDPEALSFLRSRASGWLPNGGNQQLKGYAKQPYNDFASQLTDYATSALNKSLQEQLTAKYLDGSITPQEEAKLSVLDPQYTRFINSQTRRDQLKDKQAESTNQVGFDNSIAQMSRGGDRAGIYFQPYNKDEMLAAYNTPGSTFDVTQSIEPNKYGYYNLGDMAAQASEQYPAKDVGKILEKYSKTLGKARLTAGMNPDGTTFSYPVTTKTPIIDPSGAKYTQVTQETPNPYGEKGDVLTKYLTDTTALRNPRNPVGRGGAGKPNPATIQYTDPNGQVSNMTVDLSTPEGLAMYTSRKTSGDPNFKLITRTKGVMPAENKGKQLSPEMQAIADRIVGKGNQTQGSTKVDTSRPVRKGGLIGYRQADGSVLSVDGKRLN